MRLARQQSQQAIALAQRAAQPENVALYGIVAALREGFLGQEAEARRHATDAVALSSAREVRYGAAFALALAGDSPGAAALADDLERRFPDDTAVRSHYLPAIRGRLALNRGDAAAALRLLEGASVYELGLPPSSFHGFFGALYPVYVRGQAYLAAGQGAKAAAEFQKILDHPGLVVSDPVGAMARLQVGRAWSMAGDLTSARAAYDAFLTLWSGADPDLELLRTVRGEYTPACSVEVTDPRQDAEKRILNGGCQMEHGKTPVFSHLPFAISHQAALVQRPALTPWADDRARSCDIEQSARTRTMPPGELASGHRTVPADHRDFRYSTKSAFCASVRFSPNCLS